MDPGPSALSMPWRADGILVYAQAGEQPSANDALLAMFTDAGVALGTVRAHNAAMAGL